MKTLATTLTIVFCVATITGCLQMPTKIYRKTDSVPAGGEKQQPHSLQKHHSANPPGLNYNR